MRSMLSPRTVLERNKLRLEALRNQEDVPEDHRASPEQLAPYIDRIEYCIRQGEAMLPDTFNFDNLADAERFQILMDYAHDLVKSAFQIQPINKFPEVSSELGGIKQQRIDSLDQTNQARKERAKSDHALWQALADPVFAEHPTWNKSGVALHIIEEHKINAKPGTVADQLIKPKPD